VSEFYGERNDAESAVTLLRALDLGINFLDTADAYGFGENEELVGKTIKRRRDEAFLAAKFANIRKKDDSPTGSSAANPNTSAPPATPLSNVSASSTSISTISIASTREVPIEDTVGAMSELGKAGKVKYPGLSGAAPLPSAGVHKVHPITAPQTGYSLWERHVEEEVLPTCREPGIGLVPYSPLGRGFLTGAITKPTDLDASDARTKRYPRFSAENFDKNQALVDRRKSHRRKKGRQRQPTGPDLGLNQRRRPRSHPRHQTSQIPGRKCRRQPEKYRALNLLVSQLHASRNRGRIPWFCGCGS
jgi:aryl-alcohol dehydrogenase-like predicted oxidoreductase